MAIAKLGAEGWGKEKRESEGETLITFREVRIIWFPITFQERYERSQRLKEEVEALISNKK